MTNTDHTVSVKVSVVDKAIEFLEEYSGLIHLSKAQYDNNARPIVKGVISELYSSLESVNK